ncbi:UNVERIFIED_CONTAM: hypothetical protein Slati_0832400 [Sesamum latifolium]|uniref:Integrase catalytic domain-containing protein n=1 Tax=Sesamum latifolium TaxID=2727402 RepID=A0AAW2XL76_9LAMI
MGIHIVGPFPEAKGQMKFIIISMEYFNKWVEAEAIVWIMEVKVMKFIWKNMIFRFRVPMILISDNGTQFQGCKILEWCKDMRITENFTSVGNLRANG